jgi:hypothetical protein
MAMRQYGALRERAQVIALMRLYRARWRPWDPEGPARQAAIEAGEEAAQSRKVRKSRGELPRSCPGERFFRPNCNIINGLARLAK